jgi:hypothetical protein
MRCIVAICPAGPPKLMQPILSQTMKASRKLGWAVESKVAILFKPPWPAVLCRAGGKTQQGNRRIIDEKASLAQPMTLVCPGILQSALHTRNFSTRHGRVHSIIFMRRRP